MEGASRGATDLASMAMITGVASRWEISKLTTHIRKRTGKRRSSRRWASTWCGSPATCSFGTYHPRQPPKSATAGADRGMESEEGDKKKRKEKATRPKLTPDLLFCEDGLGFVLRYLPKGIQTPRLAWPGGICFAPFLFAVSVQLGDQFV